jgi:hypothetical protein
MAMTFRRGVALKNVAVLNFDKRENYAGKTA